jgi:hypothetical protein
MSVHVIGGTAWSDAPTSQESTGEECCPLEWGCSVSSFALVTFNSARKVE